MALNNIHPISSLAFFFLGALTFLSPGARAENHSYTDAHIKAAYIFKIQDFVLWENKKKKFVCIIGSDLVGFTLAQIQQSSPALQNTQILKKTGSSSFDDCSVLFIGENQTENLGRILFSISEKNILTISDTKDFIEKGGMIGFINKDSKIKIEINLKNAKSRNIEISSKLLEISHRVLE